MPITGGSFDYEERIPHPTVPFQFKHSKATVNYDTVNDADKARELAIRQVNTALGIIIQPRKALNKGNPLPAIVETVAAEIASEPAPEGTPVQFPASQEIEGPAFIDDAVLIAACKEKQATGVGGADIRKLIADFAGAGKTAMHIPQDKRAVFLTGLAGLVASTTV
jgi:hypothetical protein